MFKEASDNILASTERNQIEKVPDDCMYIVVSLKIGFWCHERRRNGFFSSCNVFG